MGPVGSNIRHVSLQQIADVEALAAAAMAYVRNASNRDRVHLRAALRAVSGWV